MKQKYEDLLSELASIKKFNVNQGQEIQKLKLNLYSKNLEYKKQVQKNLLLGMRRIYTPFYGSEIELASFIVTENERTAYKYKDCKG